MENTALGYTATADEKNKFLGRTYGWMGLALLISAAAAFFSSHSLTLMRFLWGNRGLPFFALVIAELALVWYLSASLRKLSMGTAVALFVAYSVVNGVTLSSVFIIFQTSSIACSFFASAALFGAMSLYGFKTKANLASAGRYLLMAVLGLVIVSAVNMIITMITHRPLSWLDWLVSIATVVIFTGLTAYDSQKILRAAEHAENSETFQKLALYGALDLYLDFINIFLSLLRLFGNRRN